MNIKIIQNTNIIWSAPSNSQINGSTAAIFKEELFELNTEIIPQKGEFLVIENNEYEVIKVERTFTKKLPNNTYFDFIIKIQVKNVYIGVDYYNYFKKYSHAFDYMKQKDDPTIDMSKSDEPMVFPNTLSEWMDNIRNL